MRISVRVKPEDAVVVVVPLPPALLLPAVLAPPADAAEDDVGEVAVEVVLWW